MSERRAPNNYKRRGRDRDLFDSRFISYSPTLRQYSSLPLRLMTKSDERIPIFFRPTRPLPNRIYPDSAYMLVISKPRLSTAIHARIDSSNGFWHL